MNLTGRYRFREDWRGRQILEVEISVPFLHGGVTPSLRKRVWVLATGSDAQDLLARLNGKP